MSASVVVTRENVSVEVTPNVTIPQSAITNLVSDLASKLPSTNSKAASATISASAAISGAASAIHSSLITGDTLPSGIINSSLTGIGTLTSLTVTGNVTVDTTTFFIDSSSDRVGIGTTNPSTPLSVNGAASVTGIFNSASVGIGATAASALHVGGGAYVVNNASVGGIITSASIGIGTVAASALHVDGGAYITKNASVGGIINSASIGIGVAAASALHVNGGAYITGNASVGGSASIVGNLSVGGTITTSSAASAGALYLSASAIRTWSSSATIPITSGAGTVSITYPTGTGDDTIGGSGTSKRIYATVTERTDANSPRFIFSTAVGDTSVTVKAKNVVSTTSNDDVDINIVIVSVNP